MSGSPTYEWYARWQIEALERERSLDHSDLAKYVAARNHINAERDAMNAKLALEMARPTCRVEIGRMYCKINGITAWRWVIDTANYVKKLDGLFTLETINGVRCYISKAKYVRDGCDYPDQYVQFIKLMQNANIDHSLLRYETIHNSPYFTIRIYL